MTVVSAPPQCKFATLSYTWNSSTALKAEDRAPVLSSDSLPKQISRTILDATMVTKRLGLQYLWVDRFCIPQDDEEEKIIQIRNMDLVFGAADFTIVAAAGDENFGIPGVGATPRRDQPSAQIGDIELLASLPQSKTAILSSKWSTRGWTLQEAFLSRRCLFLTEDEAYFECASMTRREFMKVNDDLAATKADRDLVRNAHPPIFKAPGSRGGYGEYEELVHAYTKRDLTFDSDSFNAFAGIARFMAKSDSPILQISGLAIPDPRALEISGKPAGELKRQFLSSMLWIHDPPNHPCKPLRRRTSFPSWSWTGWAGEIFYGRRKLGSEQSHIDIGFGFDQNQHHDFESLYDREMLKAIQIQGPRYLHLTSYVVPSEWIDFVDVGAWSISGFHASLSVVESCGRLEWRNNHGATEGAREKLHTRRWELILLAVHELAVYFLVFENLEEFARRVGLCSIYMAGDLGLHAHLLQTEKRSITLL
ncbi:hypothetical protein H2200_011100 [Cladophialophora chaetospira]|uniref:Heterokaryon incompatibility domain-containing protein n=1 Tax=Cladophialophora chaetospira TaxID=386627 RepID=A0AA39CDH2_9EURO|nr:hypothetical protein H2200_011100 [Cladophialophora chaetospira]